MKQPVKSSCAELNCRPKINLLQPRSGGVLRSLAGTFDALNWKSTSYDNAEDFWQLMGLKLRRDLHFMGGNLQLNWNLEYFKIIKLFKRFQTGKWLPEASYHFDWFGISQALRLLLKLYSQHFRLKLPPKLVGAHVVKKPPSSYPSPKAT